jgi:hypothetical protein
MARGVLVPALLTRASHKCWWEKIIFYQRNQHKKSLHLEENALMSDLATVYVFCHFFR